MNTMTLTLTVLSHHDFDMDEALYTNKIGLNNDANSVDAIPETFWAAALYTNEEDGPMSVIFFDENFTNPVSYVPMLGYDFDNKTTAENAEAFLTALRAHPCAGSEFYGMTVVVGQDINDMPSDFLVRTAICIPEDESHLNVDDLRSLNDIQQMSVDNLPQVTRFASVDRNKDLFVDTHYGTGQSMRLLLEDGKPVIDYNMANSQLVDVAPAAGNMTMVVCVTAAACADLRPLALR